MFTGADQTIIEGLGAGRILQGPTITVSRRLPPIPAPEVLPESFEMATPLSMQAFALGRHPRRSLSGQIRSGIQPGGPVSQRDELIRIAVSIQA